METLLKYRKIVFIYFLSLFFSVLAYADVQPVCSIFSNVLQTRNDNTNITVDQGTLSYIYDSPSCKLDTGYVYKDDYSHGLECDNGEFASSSGRYGGSLSVDYGFDVEQSNVSENPALFTPIYDNDKTVSADNEILPDEKYDTISQDWHHYSFSLTYEYDKKINDFSSILNTVTFKNLSDRDLYIGTFETASDDSTNIVFDGTPDNIYIYKLKNSGSNKLQISNFEAKESIKMNTLELGSSVSTDITIKAPKVVIDNMNSINDNNTITIYADEIDIGDVSFAQMTKFIIHPYTEGKRVIFHANSITGSSSSTMIVDSGDYYTKSFSIPGSSDVSSLIASDASQLVNFYIDGDFKPGNNPGINSNGNSGNFGTLPPSNFRLFINGDLETGGGGTTFNAIVYVEGGSSLGSPTYLRGALSSGDSITIGNDSKFYYSQDIDDAGWGICVNEYDFQNYYSCGIMPTVLTSYKTIVTQQNDVYNTCTISVKDYSLVEDAKQPILCYKDANSGTLCSCDPTTSQCSENKTCTIIPEPKNKLDYTVYETPVTDTNVINTDMTFTDKEYGDYTFTKHGANITFSPTQTYSDNDTKLMILGNFQFAENDQTITFDGGDYFFKSFKIDRDTNGNINQINICAKDDIRIFVKGDFVYSGNHINDAQCGGKIFVYVEGDTQIDANGGGSSDMPIFLYSKGSVSIENSGDSNDWYGSITSEDDITITGMNINFIYDDSAKDFGYGDCQICYNDIIVNGFSMNLFNCGGFSMMSDIKVPIYTNSELYNVNVDEVHDATLFDFSFMSTNDVLDENNQTVAEATTTSSGWSNGAMGMDVSIFGGKAINYPLGEDYGPANIDEGYYQLHSASSINMGFNPCDWENSLTYVAHYEDNEGRHYDIQLSPCQVLSSQSLQYISGPFDAWDVFRDSNVAPPVDRNISTKIVNQPFKLSLSSLNIENNAYEIKQGASSVDVAIYKIDTDNSISSVSNHIAFDVNTTSHIHESDDFIVSEAVSNAAVGFKFCATYEYNSTVNMYLYRLFPVSECTNTTSDSCDTKTNGTPTWHTCLSSDNFAIRPYGFAVFGQNQYKRAGEDFNLTIKAVDEGNYSKLGNSSYANINKDAIVATPSYNATLSSLSIVSQFYKPTSSELTTMRNDTGRTDVSTCSNSGIFTVNNGSDSFVNGEANASLNFSETGILDINISEKPGFEWAKVDSDDTPDIQRYIKPSIVSYDESNITAKILMLFVPYKFETTADYKTTTSKSWVYMNDINGSNISFTTPKLAAYITYKIVAKNKNGAITKNYTKTCFPDVDEVSCPRVNGLKLNTTFDLFLNADLNISSDANISLYSENNTSTAIWTPQKNIMFSKGLNSIQEWISPFEFENGVGEAKVYLNIDKDVSKALNPIVIEVKDANTSTSWMSNPGSPKAFVPSSIDKNVTFYYGRIHAPNYSVNGNSVNVNIYREIYCKNCNQANFSEIGNESIDSVYWYVNKDDNSINDGKINNFITSSKINAVSPVAPISNGVQTYTFTYNAGLFPYKENVEINASSWLIYNPYNSSATTNDFSVEYLGDGGWAGIGKTGKTVDLNISSKGTKRLEW